MVVQYKPKLLTKLLTIFLKKYSYPRYIILFIHFIYIKKKYEYYGNNRKILYCWFIVFPIFPER